MEKLNPESFAEYTDKLKVEEFLDEQESLKEGYALW